MTNHRRLVHPDRFHEGHHVAGLCRDREIGVEAFVGVAVTEKVWCEDIKGGGQRIDYVAPEIRGAGNAMQQEQGRSLTLSQVCDVTGKGPDFSLGTREWRRTDELGGQRRRNGWRRRSFKRRWWRGEARGWFGCRGRRERDATRHRRRSGGCGGRNAWRRRWLSQSALQDDVGGAGPRNQLVLLVEHLRLGDHELLAAMHDPADRSQHAGIGGHRPEEIDMQLGGGEGLTRRQRAEDSESHRAVGEGGEGAAVNHIVGVVQIDGGWHLEGRTAVGHRDEAHIQEADIRRWRGGATQRGFEQVTTGHLRRFGHRPHSTAC